MPSLALLPEPRSLTVLGDPVSLPDEVTILRGALLSPVERRAAAELRDALQATGRRASILPRTRLEPAPNTVVLAVAGREDSAGLAAPTGESPEAYRLIVRDGAITVVGTSGIGMYRGVGALRQLLATTGGALTSLEIDDAPVMSRRGLMLDVSRGAVPTLDTLKCLADLMASVGLNMLQLYVEDTFAFRSNPAIGCGWGPLQPEEIVEFDAYCAERAIELVPCLQSLSHQRRILDLPEYEHLAYTDERWSFAPGEETYRLLGELFDDYLPCFSSRSVNICCDESYDLTGTTDATHAAIAATGEAAAVAEAPAGARLYQAHIARLAEMLAARGKSVMVWDDIFLHWPGLLTEMPEDTVLLDWFYEAADAYPQLQQAAGSGLPTMVCPGTASWNSLFARTANARINIRNFVRDGVAHDSIGMLNTAWGDNGHVNLFAADIYGLVYGAAESWNPGALDDEEFERRLGHTVFHARGGDAAVRAMRAMGEACMLPGVNRINGSCTWAMLFRDPVMHEVCAAIPDETVARVQVLAREAMDALRGQTGAGRSDRLTLDELRFAAHATLHAAERTILGRRVAAHVDGTVDRDLWRALSALKIDLHELRHEFEMLWLARYNPEGRWMALDLFDEAARIETRWRDAVAPRYQFGA
jgi:hexosaminidase